METFDCIKTRKSVRKYDKKDVPNGIIGQIIFAGTQAPSAGNIQPWEFVVVKDEKIKKELSIAALRQNHVFKAPVVIVVSADSEKSGDKYGERGKKLYSIQDTAAAIENMLLVAHDLGLGACWVGAFEEEKVKSILNMPDRLRPVALLTIGYPLSYDTTKKPKRLPFENITYVDKSGQRLFEWMESPSGEWKFKIKPLEHHIRKLKEKLDLREK